MYGDTTGKMFFLVTALIGAAVGDAAGAVFSYVTTGEVTWESVVCGAAAGAAVGIVGGAAGAYYVTGSYTASTGAVLSGSSAAAAGAATVGSVLAPEITQLFQSCGAHMFSEKHIADGIMELGSSREEIFATVVNIANSFSDKWQTGSNEIRTVINGIETTIRFFIEEGRMISIDAFVGYSSRVIGNLIT